MIESHVAKHRHLALLTPSGAVGTCRLWTFATNNISVAWNQYVTQTFDCQKEWSWLVSSQETSIAKLTVEQKMRERERGQKAAREGRPRSWSEPWAYPFESDEHYEERKEAFNQGYGIIDPVPMSIQRSPP